MIERSEQFDRLTNMACSTRAGPTYVFYMNHHKNERNVEKKRRYNMLISVF